MEKYFAPALTNWVHYTPTHIQPLAYRDLPIKAPQDYRCLILGSNEGKMEQFLCQWGFVGEIVASDIADRALARAAAKAKQFGYDNIRHVQADLNTDDLLKRTDGRFDFIVAEGVLHHIHNLERCIEMLKSLLAPQGVLIASEFVGPFRFQLPELQVFWINHVLRGFPRILRFGPTGQDDDLLLADDEQHAQAQFVPPTEDAVAAFDPSEAISGHLLKDLLLKNFRCIEDKTAGGTINTYLQGYIDYRLAGSPPFDRWMYLALNLEYSLIDAGILPSDYEFLVLTH